ncbi:MAG TPA: CAAX prenyl protease-related protein [Candidatus Limnocylindria bacterium]|nr:CAAX prenyl protease-related protein [Candidatus Limnocylindria bacterium]
MANISNDTASAKPTPDRPELYRVLPFVIFLVLTSLQGKYFDGSEYWIYLAKGMVAAVMLWVWRDKLREMRWAVSVEAVVVGVAIAVLWVGLEGRVPTLDRLWYWGRQLVSGTPMPSVVPDKPWNPVAHFIDLPALGWGFVVARFVIRSLVVPPLEEVFYRSFFYRFIAQPKFMEMPLGVWHPMAFLVTCLAFGLAHPGQWLAGIICGAAYQWLVIRKKRLGDAMTAHAITNLGVGAWAVATNQWQFT